jgi:hypothetical protein
MAHPDGRNKTVRDMARVLAEHVVELRNARVCRDALHAAGFKAAEIADHLCAARHRARRLRELEIDGRYEAMWNNPDGTK